MTINRIDLKHVDLSDVITGERIPLAKPGEILQADFLEPLGISIYRLAKAIHVPAFKIKQITKHGLAITADTAVRLAAFFGTDAEFWLNLQSHYDAEIARERMAETIATIRPFQAAA